MGNSPSNAAHRLNNNAHYQPPPPPRSRPLKNKKRSIVDHPALIAAPPSTPVPIAPKQPQQASSPIPIPIPSHVTYTPPPRSTPPPVTTDSFDADLLHAHEESTHRRIPYNSTHSFGAVRRGGVQGTVWPHDNDPPPSSSSSLPAVPPGMERASPAAFVPEVVYSSIPLRIHHAESSSRPRGRPVKRGDNQIDNDPNDDEDDPDAGAQLDDPVEVVTPTTIVWRGGGKDVYLAGTFDQLEWRSRVRMRYDPTASAHSLTLDLPLGTYRLKFIVDDVWRCSDDLPTATDDQTGNLVNYIDVADPNPVSTDSAIDEERQGRVDQRVMKANRRRTYPAQPRKASKPLSRPPYPYHPPQLPPLESGFWSDPDTDMELEAQVGWERGRDGVVEKWTNVIPEPLVSVAQQEEAYMNAVEAQRELRRGGAGTRGSLVTLGPGGIPNIPPAPRLPRHLDKVLLNVKSGGSGSGGGSGNGSSSRSRTRLEVQADDSSVLPVPNHVVLHHLGTSAIKNGVLAVSDTTRYIGKYITTIYYKPA